eukprot:COSAG02_NODE_30971_length_541_cov_1.780543_1_plen_27_part_10
MALLDKRLGLLRDELGATAGGGGVRGC